MINLLNDIYCSLQDYIKNNYNIILLYFTILIGAFISSPIKNKHKIFTCVFYLCLIGLPIVNYFYYGSMYSFIITIPLSYLFYKIYKYNKDKDNIVKKKWLKRKLKSFTKKAKSKSKLMIFGGDIDFFGNVDVDNTSKKSIFKNKQIKLIIGKFNEVHILCIKPSDKDYSYQLRLGYLLKELNNYFEIKIKFYDIHKNCCYLDNIALESCKECINLLCPLRYCDKITENFSNLTYNPDLNIRGRIITKSDATGLSAIIFTTHTKGKDYFLKEYNSNSKELNIYKDIWGIWWNRCELAEEQKYITKYNDFINKNLQIKV